MQKFDFSDAVEQIVSQDPRFDKDAYFFLKDALDYTVEQSKKSNGGKVGHVSGQQLLGGIREFALKYFGPMVTTVFETWGIRSCEHFGMMVYHLIERGIFGKSENDSPDDFKGVYTFEDAFVAPYRPSWRPTPIIPPRQKRLRRRELKTQSGGSS